MTSQRSSVNSLGRLAANNGMDAYDNPYPVGDARRQWWADGYLEAAAEFGVGIEDEIGSTDLTATDAGPTDL